MRICVVCNGVRRICLGDERLTDHWTLHRLWALHGGGGRRATRLSRDVDPSRTEGDRVRPLSYGVGLAILPASLIAGLLWDSIGPAAPFAFGSTMATLAAVLFAWFR
jgi:hypothetical protein